MIEKYDLMKNYKLDSDSKKYKIESEYLFLSKFGHKKYNYIEKGYRPILTYESKEELKNTIMEILKITYCIGKYRIVKYLEEIYQNVLYDIYVYDKCLIELKKENKISLITETTKIDEYKYIKAAYDLESSISKRTKTFICLGKGLYRKAKIKNLMDDFN